MGIFRALKNLSEKYDNYVDSVLRYRVTCKYCGETGAGSTLENAIKSLQCKNGKCGQNCHDPIITQQPE